MMRTLLILLLVMLATAAMAAPPVPQAIGKADIAIGDMLEADCRVCHATGTADRHHMLYGQSVVAGSFVPYPDADGDGSDDPLYGCLNCHDSSFTAARDCTLCHIGSTHHSTEGAQTGDCVSCHGDIVDNIDDGHYIPAYATSMVTPSPGGGIGLPLNSRGNGAGGCTYCHDDDGLPTPVILTNKQLHHGAVYGATPALSCSFCHDIHEPLTMRKCEGCHGPDSLHNIQADSPRAPAGTIIVGGEDAGYGHVGRDAGPNDSDCWGCHGFAFAATAISGPLVPTVFNSDVATMGVGVDTAVVLTGSAFTNYAGSMLFESEVILTAADGSFVTLTPTLLDEGLLTVTVPGDTSSGNYKLRAVKDGFKSNPVSLTIIPDVVIKQARYNGAVIIRGSGFGSYVDDLGSSVTARVLRKRRVKTRRRFRVETATIISWSDTKIVAKFSTPPTAVTVKTVFGKAAATVKVKRRR